MNIFITGITGTLGTALAKYHAAQDDAVYGCARSEARAHAWLNRNKGLAKVYLADAGQLADKYSDIGQCLGSMDRVYHCAAMKHVDLCEEHPYEALLQNVALTQTIAITCKQYGTSLVVISSDKACLPQGVYGATKLLAEKIAIREGAAVVRLGNLIGSSGSVFQLWLEAGFRGDPLKVTDRKMTRYFIPTTEAAKFIATNPVYSAVVIPDPILAIEMGEIAEAMRAHFKWKAGIIEIGKRLGETQHQWLIAPGESYYTDNYIRHVLTPGGSPSPYGLCSSTAKKWDLMALLKTLEQQ